MMLKYLLSICVLSLCYATQAISAEKTLKLDADSIVAAVSFNWNNDAIEDKAILVLSPSVEDAIDLIVLLSSPNGDFQELSLKNVASKMPLSPVLSLNKQNSLVIASSNQNVGVGRDIWTETVIFSYRDNKVLLSGYKYDEYDKLALTSQVCEINFLTKTAVAGKKKFTLKGLQKFPILMTDYPTIDGMALCADKGK